MRVLVIGGTGPTGPHIVGGLQDRGHQVTIFHRGVHEPPGLEQVEHIHGDPHFRESIDEALGTRDFDVVLAMYGRVKLLAPALAGRCAQFVSIGGVPIYRGFFPVAGEPYLPIPVTETHHIVTEDRGIPALAFSRRLAEAEQAVLESHPRATIFRFSTIYWPNNARPAEWSVVKRIRDGRPYMVLPEGGIQIHSRCAARNAAAFVLAAVDRPGVAAGQVYNVADSENWTFRQWAEMIVEMLGGKLEILGLPSDIAVEAATTMLPLAATTATHVVVSPEKAKRELGYRPVVTPIEALTETIAWYGPDRSFESSATPSLTDRFDYATEDALVDAYRACARRIEAEIEQHPQPPVHSMPHPKAPGGTDHRGR